MKFKYDFKSQADGSVNIDIDGIIGDDWWSGLEDSKNTKEAVTSFLRRIDSSVTEKIVVNIDSIGGDVSHGLSIYDSLKQHPAAIEVNVTGMTASAATIISQAADPGKLNMSKASLFLIHKAWTGLWGNANEMQTTVDSLNTIDNLMGDIYAARSGKTKESIFELMNADNGNGKWINAEDAKDAGLVDNIFDPGEKVSAISTEAFRNHCSNIVAIGKILTPEAFIQSTQNKPMEKKVMENEFKQADIEAAEKKGFEAGLKVKAEEISKHLAFIGSADNETVLSNIKDEKPYLDCIETYAEQKAENKFNAQRIEGNNPENLQHHDASTEIDSEDSVNENYEAAKKLGLIK